MALMKRKREQPWKFVIQEFTAKMSKEITTKSTLDRFGSLLVSKGFMTLDAMNNRLETMGVGPDRKVMGLLTAVAAHINTAGPPELCTERFNKLMEIFIELSSFDLVDKMTTKYREYCPSYQDMSPKEEQPTTPLTEEPEVTSTSVVEASASNPGPAPVVNEQQHPVSTTPPDDLERPAEQGAEEVESVPLSRKPLNSESTASAKPESRDMPPQLEVEAAPRIRTTQPEPSPNREQAKDEVQSDLPKQEQPAPHRNGKAGKQGWSCSRMTAVCVIAAAVIAIAVGTYTVYSPASHPSLPTGSTLPQSTPVSSSTRPSTSHSDIPDTTGTPIRSVKELDLALQDIGNWKELCYALGVTTATMEALTYEEVSVTVKKTRCLTAFYNHDVEDGVEVNWERVVETVADYPIQNKRLAKKIAKKYIDDKRDEL